MRYGSRLPELPNVVGEKETSLSLISGKAVGEKGAHISRMEK